MVIQQSQSLVSPHGQESLHAPVTIIRNARGPLTKRAWLNSTGELEFESAAQLAEGSYRSVFVRCASELAAIVRSLKHDEALAFGVAKNGTLNGLIATKDAVATGRAALGAIARSKDDFGWSDGPGVMMLDIDLPRLAQSSDCSSIEALSQVLLSACPELAEAPMVGYPSARACLFRAADGTQLRGVTGARFYVFVDRAADIRELGKRIHQRLVLAGHGFPFVSTSGSIHVRSIIDMSVLSPERLDFISGVAHGPELVQNRGEPLCWNDNGSPLGVDKLPILDEVDAERFRGMVESIYASALPEALLRRPKYVAERKAAGRTVAATWNPRGGVEFLDGRHQLELDDGTLVTVDQVLAAPDQFHERNCADPLEPDYSNGDLRIARLFLKQATPVVSSFAHGGTIYMLRPSAGEEFAVEEGKPATSLPPAPQDNHHTDMGNAARFARKYRDTLRYANGSWFEWDGRRWARVMDGRIERYAKVIARDLFDEAKASQDKDERKFLFKWAHRSEFRERIRAAIDLARGELAVLAGQLDGDPWLFNVMNGTIDLQTGLLRQHTPADGVTKLAPVTFDPNATASRWLEFLDQVFGGDKDLIDGVQRMVGYSLSGSTREHALFFLHGTGANGKSTFLETLRAMLGDYATQADFGTFLARQSEGPRNDIARLHGARFVAATELRQGQHLDEAVVKSLTGGDTVTARFLHKEFFEFKPSFKIWLAANHKPAVRGDDYAVWRRIRLVPFTVTIPEERRDPELVAALTSELPGILNWALEGCLAWQRSGLRVPSAVQDATNSYRAEANAVAAFLHERCLVELEGRVGSTDLYAAYVAWCQARGEGADSLRAFGERLAAHDPGRISKGKSNGTMVWRGVELRAPEPAAAELQEILS